MSIPKKGGLVNRYRHINHLMGIKEVVKEKRVSKKQYPLGEVEIEKPQIGMNIAAHLLLRVLDSAGLNWYRTRKTLTGWKEGGHE